MTPTLLSIQSHVVYGHVGNSAVALPLQRLGAEVLPLHTVQFSSHAGYAGWRGRVFDAAAIDECVAGLAAVGALERCDGVLSGYLGKAEVGEAMLRAVAAVRAANPARRLLLRSGDRRRRARNLCRSRRRRIPAQSRLAGGDGRHPQRVRTVVRHRLSRRQPRRRAARDRRLADDRAARRAGDVADAERYPADALDMIAADGGGAWRLRTPRLPIAVNGAGDLIAALFFFHWLRRRSAADALAAAAASVYGVVAATLAAGRRELRLVETQDEFVRPTHRFRPEAI